MTAYFRCLVLVLLSSHPMLAQAANLNTPPTRSEKPKVLTLEDWVSQTINSGIWEGIAEKHIANTGDSAGVAISKAIGGRVPGKSQIEMSLIVLRSAFVDPAHMQYSTDREPRATFFVLRSFEMQTTEDAVKKEIAETRKYIEEKTAEYNSTEATPK